jgi:antitoxin component YwqK of YwqJK toxin-antitoxin module
MKFNFSLFILLIFTVLSFHSTVGQEKINQFNANGERVGVWKKYYSNSRLRYIGQFKDGKEIGTFKFYSALSSEHPTVIKSFEKDSNLAKVSYYDETGVLKSTGEMNGKIRIGKWFYYHLDGKSILSEENYENGILNGSSKTFYNTGKITEEMFYENGKLHGNLKRYSDEGVLLDDLNYLKGILHGAAKYYNIKGKLIYWGDYENDEKVGKWEYFENGKPKDFIEEIKN